MPAVRPRVLVLGFSVRVAKKKGPSAFVLMMCLFDSGGEIRESAAQSVEQAPSRVLDNGLAAAHKMTIFFHNINRVSVCVCVVLSV